MKKKLEAELISIAHRILQLKNTATLPKLQEEARQLYEKLTILSFAESNFSDPQPTIGEIRNVLDGSTISADTDDQDNTIKTKPSISINTASTVESIEPVEEIVPIVSEEVNLTPQKITADEPEKPEIVIEKINEKISEDLFIPAINSKEEDISISEASYENDTIDPANTAPQSMPILDTVNEAEEKPKSLNDQLKKGITIGLNDRLAFIKHLFNGSATDYNRVLSQLNTLNSKSGARQFIKNIVKPDYNNWVDKEEYEERFIEIVINKYEY